jgi:hypothetical protein
MTTMILGGVVGQPLKGYIAKNEMILYSRLSSSVKPSAVWIANFACGKAQTVGCLNGFYLFLNNTACF